MILCHANTGIVRLQIVARNPDGTSKLDVVSGSVRVYQVNSSGTEVIKLAATPLVGTAAPIWRYQWQPATLPDGAYIIEYTLTDGAITYAPVTDDLISMSDATVDVEGGCTSALAAYGTDGVAITGEAAAAATSILANITTDHGAGLYNGVATGQAMRDALALGLTPGTTIADDSVDDYLEQIQNRAAAGGVFGTALTSSASKIYVGDIKIPIYFDCVENISTGTLFRIDVVKPGGAAASWIGSLFGTHEIRYLTTGADIATAGVYHCTPYFELAGGMKAHRPTVDLTVYAVGT